MKKVLNILSVILIIIIIVMLYFFYLSNRIDKTTNKLNQNIQANYPLSEDIIYSNQYGNYYIFTTKKHVIVLNKEYHEILKEDQKSIKPLKENMELIYKTNKLMHEKTIIKDNVLTYEYYDAKTGKLIKKTVMEQQ